MAAGDTLPGGAQDYVVWYIHPETFQIISPEDGSVEGAIPVWASETMPQVPTGVDFPEFAESTEDVLRAYLQYGPAFAEAQFAEQEEYLPRQAQLAQDLAAQYQPQQLALQLALTGEYLPQFAAIDQAIIEAERAGDLETVLELSSYLPQIREAAEDPTVTAIRSMLSGNISDQLSAGTQLTPRQSRVVEQNLRASEAARGIELGQGSANREAVAKALEGQELLNQRMAQAQSFLAQEAATQIDPFLAITGRPSTALATGTGQQAAGLALPTAAGQTPNSAAFLNTAAGVNSQQSQNAINNANYALAATQYQTALDMALANPTLS